MREFVNLYRHVLKLHRLLPSEMRIVGDNYLKTEFRLHRSIKDPVIIETFYSEWANYAQVLLEQVAHDVNNNSVEKPLGAKVDLKQLSHFNDDQLYNLMELRKHALQEETSEEAIKSNK